MNTTYKEGTWLQTGQKKLRHEKQQHDGSLKMYQAA